MKIKLHRPKPGLWNLALLVFVVGLLAFIFPVPIVSQYAFHIVAVSSLLLLLGTWIL